jgi:hypothetical protein
MKVLFLTLPLLAVFIDPSEGGAPVLKVSPAGRKFCCNSQQEWYAFGPPTRVFGPSLRRTHTIPRLWGADASLPVRISTAGCWPPSDLARFATGLERSMPSAVDPSRSSHWTSKLPMSSSPVKARNLARSNAQTLAIRSPPGRSHSQTSTTRGHTRACRRILWAAPP